ncbi:MULTISPECIES: hypothetical protein [unclassified Modicisalibacter]|uniref:hypothetical protein n=1 Tax=unclassified Modicisalibacter TaxID=2679913 RepID=UPI001CCFEE7F|nr:MULTISPECIES: hypothetical protein [unclassified Modicisalibacter]MBZ9557215.1 hypothetical protein [Modicisalibacter sp. R2A 31.J]MBZ9574071.1 hypothetical protein [Modicisalibacter sp. MOD 31.J]
MHKNKPTLGSQFSEVFDTLKAKFDHPQSSSQKNKNAKPKKEQRDRQSRRKNIKHEAAVKSKPRNKGKKRYVEVKKVDTRCYDNPGKVARSRNDVSPPAETPPLHEISADVEHLDIRLPTANAIASPSIDPNIDMTASDGEPAVIGLDFGTAFTKAVIHWRNRHYIVDWKEIIDSEDPYLLPSSFSEHDSGIVLLGDVSEVGWTSRKGLKISIIENTDDNFSSDVEATIFISLVTRHIRGWAERTFKDMGATTLRWRLHLGLPASPFQSEKIQERLYRIAKNAWSASFYQGQISRAVVTKIYSHSSRQHTIPIKVVPEFLAQLHPYLKSSQSQEGLHGLIDIGAGTIDFVLFNIFRVEDSDRIPIFGDNVAPLGSHYLIATLSGRAGQSLQWEDSDASKAFSFFSERTEEIREQVSKRASIFKEHLKKGLSKALKSTHQLYPNAPVWKKQNEFPFFLCGGGSHISFYKTSIKDRKSLSISYKKIPLPKNVVGDIKAASFHRYSVAYGLSILPRNLAAITPTRDIEYIMPPDPVEIEDRDANR